MQKYTTPASAAVEVGKRVNYAVKLLVFGINLWINPVIGQNALYNSNFCTVSPYPETRTLIQPDGSPIEVLILGNRYASYLETTDGYTVLQDPLDGYYKYAVPGLDGDLFLSNVRVSAVGKKTGIEKIIRNQVGQHLRYSGKTLFNKLQNFEKAVTLAASAPPNVFPSTGTRKALLILIKYPDLSSTYTLGNFQNLANQDGYNLNGQSGSFRDYYQDISYGALTINTDVYGWYTANNNRATYGDGAGDLAAINLIREAVDRAEVEGVNFANYDGDGDGKVDVVMVIHAGRGKEESGDDADIWSHRWVLSANNKQVTYDGKLINDYIVQPEKFGPTNLTNIGVLCHEFGHALGLPDLYDTDGSSSGLGKWCLMAGGTWNNSGKTPAQMSAWCKKELGWVNPTLVNNSGTISNLPSVNGSTTRYRINTPVPTEYFLLENRQQIGWDAHLPGHGLTIYHIDETQTNNKNEARYWVNLEQADGLNDLNNDMDSGDEGDPFPGNTSKTVFDCTSSPNSGTYNLAASNVAISGISENGSLVSFNYGLCETCSGTPTPGSTVANMTTTCVGSTVDLSLSSPDLPDGLTYQWQSSSNGVNFTNISGAVFPVYQPTISQALWFKCLVTCTASNQIAGSNPLKINLGPASDCYCTAGATETQFEKIDNVQFNTINNSSTENIGYQDFTSIATYVTLGSTYNFSASIFNPFDQDQILVWIDFNQDGDFTDSGEAVFVSTTGAGPHNTMIQIPATATPGQTRMRVRLHDSGLQPNSTPCGDSKYGQVEDYTLLIGSGNSGNCDDMMTLLAPDDNILSGTYKGEVNIQLTAKNQIMAGNVTYDAGVAVILDTGFEIKNGAQLVIQIDGCGNN